MLSVTREWVTWLGGGDVFYVLFFLYYLRDRFAYFPRHRRRAQRATNLKRPVLWCHFQRIDCCTNGLAREVECLEKIKWNPNPQFDNEQKDIEEFVLHQV